MSGLRPDTYVVYAVQRGAGRSTASRQDHHRRALRRPPESRHHPAAADPARAPHGDEPRPAPSPCATAARTATPATSTGSSPTGCWPFTGCSAARASTAACSTSAAAPGADVRAALAGLKPMLVGVSTSPTTRRQRAALPDGPPGPAPAPWSPAAGCSPPSWTSCCWPASQAGRGGARQGEGPVLELARRLAAGSRDFAAVPGLSFRAEGDVRRTPDAGRGPTWTRCTAPSGGTPSTASAPTSLTRLPRHQPRLPRRPLRSFCCTPAFWGQRLRRRSAAAVVDEMDLLRRRFGVTYFGIRDDSFTADRAHVLEFCRLVRARPGRAVELPVRVNLMDEELAVAMRQAGCDQIQFGVESASPRLLERLDKSVRPGAHPARAAGVPRRRRAHLGLLHHRRAEPDRHRPGHGPGAVPGARPPGRIVSPLAYTRARPCSPRPRPPYGGSRDIPAGETGGAPRPPRRRRPRLPGAGGVHRGGPPAQRLHRGEALRSHLGRTGECLSALLGWGRFAEGHSRRRRALNAYMDIVRRWPGSAWGYRAVADMLNGLGRKWDYRDWEAAAWPPAASRCSSRRRRVWDRHGDHRR